MLAVRDNELAASAMGLSPTRVKLIAFAISGALAGLAGGLLVGLVEQFTTDRFGATASLQVVAVAVVGGLASITGAVLGALLVVGLPAFFPNSAEVALLTSGVGILDPAPVLPRRSRADPLQRTRRVLRRPRRSGGRRRSREGRRTDALAERSFRAAAHVAPAIVAVRLRTTTCRVRFGVRSRASTTCRIEVAPGRGRRAHRRRTVRASRRS